MVKLNHHLVVKRYWGSVVAGLLLIVDYSYSELINQILELLPQREGAHHDNSSLRLNKTRPTAPNLDIRPIETC